jgi:predicted transcriptional regulator
MSITLGEIKKTSFRLDSDLVNQLSHLAIDRNTTVTALLTEAIKQYLKAAKK